MVEERHESGGSAESSSRPDGRTEGILRRLTRIVVGLLGLAAAARSVLATSRPEDRPATTRAEVHATEGEEVRHPDSRIEHPQVRYEHRDTSFGWILGIGITTLALGAVILSVLLWFFNLYKNYQATIKRSPFPLAAQPSEALPARPRLEQVDRLAGIETPNVYVREIAKEEILNSYGSTPEQEFVHIPIDRAMTLLANKLPARPEPPASQRRRQNGLVDAGESNSGRMFREEPRWYEH
jgi:hypothetical protein